jgi:hypothetical protein
MAVKPVLIHPHHPPPRYILVILDNTGALDVDVILSLKIDGQDRDFSLGNKLQSLTNKAKTHTVSAAAVVDSVCYLHDWAPGASRQVIEVSAEDPSGSVQKETATII